MNLSDEIFKNIVEWANEEEIPGVTCNEYIGKDFNSILEFAQEKNIQYNEIGTNLEIVFPDGTLSLVFKDSICINAVFFDNITDGQLNFNSKYAEKIGKLTMLAFKKEYLNYIIKLN